MKSAPFVLVLLLAACGDSVTAPATEPTRHDTIAALVPGTFDAFPDPARRCPPGSSVVRTAADGAKTVLSEGLAAAGAPSVRWDGERVLFVGRKDDAAPFSVWECAPDGSDRREVVRHATDCQGAAHLPDGRVVYAAAIPDPSPLAGARSAQALFVAKGDGSAGDRITFSGGFDADPTVLSDGRILFASWRSSPAGGRLGLFTVHPDGTGFAPFHLASGSAVLPYQRADLDVAFVVLEPNGSRAFAASWDAPMSRAVEIQARETSRSLAPRPRPQGHLSIVNAERAWATLYCVDARKPGADLATHARFHDADRVLGTTALAADGSFHVRLPADRPLRIELLDAAGRPVAQEHGTFWLRRNEVRGCVGCHDDVEKGPPNVRPAAVLEDPVDLCGAGRRGAER